uniref:Alpha-1-microglobulin/bikunin precursor n=1 Tax=Accipiter nisus TaxID=211598 RepID=A0A8B9NEV1_9AVES
KSSHMWSLVSPCSLPTCGYPIQAPMPHLYADSCRLSQDSGPCSGMVSRFFYNSSSMACETFLYGGCLGNGNNFYSEKECLQACRTEEGFQEWPQTPHPPVPTAACRLPVIQGPCQKPVTRWAFDAARGKCITFSYGGCKGNGNQFYSEKECKEYCPRAGWGAVGSSGGDSPWAGYASARRVTERFSGSVGTLRPNKDETRLPARGVPSV